MNGLIGIAKLFGKLDDARRKLALWRYDYNNIGPHSSLEYKTADSTRQCNMLVMSYE